MREPWVGGRAGRATRSRAAERGARRQTVRRLAAERERLSELEGADCGGRLFEEPFRGAGRAADSYIVSGMEPGWIDG